MHIIHRIAASLYPASQPASQSASQPAAMHTFSGPMASFDGDEDDKGMIMPGIETILRDNNDGVILTPK